MFSLALETAAFRLVEAFFNRLADFFAVVEQPILGLSEIFQRKMNHVGGSFVIALFHLLFDQGFVAGIENYRHVLILASAPLETGEADVGVAAAVADAFAPTGEGEGHYKVVVRIFFKGSVFVPVADAADLDR